MTRNDLLASAVGVVLMIAGGFCVLMMVAEWDKMPEPEPLCYQEWPPPTDLEARHVVAGGEQIYVCGYATIIAGHEPRRVFRCWRMRAGCEDAW